MGVEFSVGDARAGHFSKLHIPVNKSHSYTIIPVLSMPTLASPHNFFCSATTAGWDGIMPGVTPSLSSPQKKEIFFA